MQTYSASRLTTQELFREAYFLWMWNYCRGQHKCCKITHLLSWNGRLHGASVTVPFLLSDHILHMTYMFTLYCNSHLFRLHYSGFQKLVEGYTDTWAAR
jgi:hypothetical protein